MQQHNKLVRDKIPEIIEANDETPNFIIIEDDTDYLRLLLEKDVEESQELAEGLNLEELADKLEVLYAIAKVLGHTPQDVERVRVQKAQKRGGFDGRIFLKSTE